MNPQLLIGLDMQLPVGKIPGYYAQIVKGIAERAPLFDRFKELLIFDSEDYLPSVLDLLNHYKVSSERCELLLLPHDGLEQGDLFEDYAFVTRSGNIYVDLKLTALFSLNASKPEAEPAPALMQLKEHLIGSLSKDGDSVYMIDRQLAELAERIAIAFGCSVIWQYE